ncbi:quinone-dependent dihydroorotate dehydrogenase [Neisseria shayeganii]|uniref:Dihydroorotate dehydrogenase (quinone) n=1 Tax=Neisseria shayeganii TaxID=607712 RepID=A0A7D7RV18_9NEIS|nr:quinone-dependent dihydroorotate dehydrogenase [Neisseria shayeganii]QMT40564.1 quinone-dependent dihydroorotate dehydrogenase [Neisseria shayeganii]
MYALLRRFLFQMDAERAHHLTLSALQLAYRSGLSGSLSSAATGRQTEWMGLQLPNPVGLAAGLDKNGDYIDALASLGFGFIEIGTVTPLPQPGNPQPRLFRVPEHQAVINRMGFNNGGIDQLITNVLRSRFQGVLGINIGKNAVTPMEKAADDYLICLEKAYPHAGYITVNISSPNTKNLRALQGGDELHALLDALKNRQSQLATQHGRYVPLAVKIAPDLDDAQIEAVAEVALQTEIDGIIATNTTIDKTALGNHPLAGEAGGLSGLPVREKSRAVLQKLAARLNGRIPLTGVGGIVCGQDAADKLADGATAVQIYSGLVYRGPELVGECIRATR